MSSIRWDGCNLARHRKVLHHWRRGGRGYIHALSGRELKKSKNLNCLCLCLPQIVVWWEVEQMWGEFYTKSQMAVDGIHQILFTQNSFCLRPSTTVQRYCEYSFSLNTNIFVFFTENKYFCRSCVKFRLKAILEATFKYLTSFVRRGHYLAWERVWNWIFNSRMSWLLEMYRFAWIMQK